MLSNGQQAVRPLEAVLRRAPKEAAPGGGRAARAYLRREGRLTGPEEGRRRIRTLREVSAAAAGDQSGGA